MVICRYNRVWVVGENTIKSKWNTYNKRLIRTFQKKLIPDGIDLYYGSAYIIATRDFLQWATTDLVALNLINWSQDTYSPDEIIWATLSRINQKQNIVYNDGTNQQSGTSSNLLPPPTPNLVLSGSDSVKPQFSYARSVKWEDQALEWNPPYPVCQVRFPVKYPQRLI